MVYRQSPSEMEPRAVEGDVLLRVDASGRAGASGQPGHSGASGHGSGQNGSAGGPGGGATFGQPGGRVVVWLASEGVASARVRGTRALSDGTERAVEKQVAFGDAGFVDLVARGGAGGHGGHGGRGGDGATGSRGSDATRYSSGGNGGRGGDGGRGGSGTSGADGGAGGSVVVRVDDADTHLLMLVRQGVEGGAGGVRGAHGAGGSGGAGGAGGSSHSWTDTEHYTDAQGKSQTRTTFHSNSGGSSGPSGMPGPSGSGPLYDGRDGAKGTFAIEVQGAAGVERYAGRYHLMLSAIRLRTDDTDGVFEPGEIVRVDGLRVRNVGAMPSPSSRAITLDVRDSRWCGALEGEVLEVPRSVPAGGDVEVPGTLSFELSDYAPLEPDDPLIASERVSLRAHVVDVNRSFEAFEPDALAAAATMRVRFPIAASVLEGLVALAPGEVTRVRFAIRNQSSKPLGSRSESKRRVRARLALYESELDDGDVALFDEHDRRAPLAGEGMVRELELLDAGADWIFEGALAMRERAPAYRELRLRLTVEIGRLDMPDVLRVVQHRELKVRCVRPLAPGASMNWLLVTHHRTDREEIDAWEALAREMQRTLAVWDLSLHGHLALEAAREDGPPLLERLGGGLVVVLGYPLTTPRGEQRPHGFLGPTTLARAAASSVDVLFAGGTPDLAAMLAPEATESGVAAADGERALLARIEARCRETDQAFSIDAELHEIGLFFEKSTAARVEKRARALARELVERFPQRRCVVVWDHAPAPRGSWIAVKRERIGTIRVLARPAAKSGAAHLAIEDQALADPAFAGSDACRRAIAIASGPDDQLDALARALDAGDVARARIWSDALLLGLASEQLAMLRRTRWGADLSLSEIRADLPRLGRLALTPLLGAHDPASPVGAVVVELAATLLFFADSQAKLWEKIPPLSFFRRAPGLDTVTESLVGSFLDVQSGDEDVRRVLRDRVAVAQRALRARWKEDCASGSRLRDRGAWARRRVLGAIDGDPITTDDELLIDDDGTAIELADWSARLAGARAGDVARDALIASVESQRRDLLLPIRAGELLRERVAAPEEAHEPQPDVAAAEATAATL